MYGMSKTFDFLKGCGPFFVTTVSSADEGVAPAARPFGGIMEYEGELYFGTSNTKQVYSVNSQFKHSDSNPKLVDETVDSD